MNTTKLAVYGSITLLVLSILTFVSIELFDSSEIFTYSYDRSETYILANYKTTYMHEDSQWEASYSTRFSVRNVDNFIDEVILPHDDLLFSYQVMMGYPPQQITFYYFEYEGQLFYLHQEMIDAYYDYDDDEGDLDKMFVFGPACSTVDDNGVIIRFPFPFPDYFFFRDDLIPWRDMPTDDFASYQDFKTFYDYYDDTYVQFDDDNKLITLRTSVFDYGLDEQNTGLSTDYLIQLKFYASGFTINLLDLK